MIWHYPWWLKCWIHGCDTAVPDPYLDPDHIGLCDEHHEELRASH